MAQVLQKDIQGYKTGKSLGDLHLYLKGTQKEFIIQIL